MYCKVYHIYTHTLCQGMVWEDDEDEDEDDSNEDNDDANNLLL